MSQWTRSDLDAARSLFFLGGRLVSDGRIVYPRKPSERAHLAYYGTTRSGKTYAIEHVLQQLAFSREAGFFYIDPHGASYWRMASFLRQHGITDRVLFWDLNDREHVVTYDPFDAPGQSPAYIAGNLTSTILSTLGKQVAASEQPHLKTTTESGLLSLVKLGLPFLLARDLFDPRDTEIKRAIAARLANLSGEEGSGDSMMLGAIAELPRLLDRYHELSAPYRRLANLFQDDRLRLTFTTTGVDFRKLMDEGWIVLVNAESRDQYAEAVTLFTRLLVSSLFMAAKRRRKADETPPFFLAIDEASRYLTADTARILSETAGYGFYLLVGMQSIEQARLENEESYAAIRTNVKAEVVMRLTDFEESLFFARRFFSHYLDFKAVKEEEFQTVPIPRTVPHVVRGHSRTLVDGASRSDRGDDSLEPVQTGSASYSDQESEMEGFHVEYDYEKRRTVVYWSIDEQERTNARRFYLRYKGQTSRFGIVRLADEPPCEIEIPVLANALYPPEEMADWLRGFKASQPMSLTFVEAQQRFGSL